MLLRLRSGIIQVMTTIATHCGRFRGPVSFAGNDGGHVLDVRQLLTGSVDTDANGEP